jgi:signal transduction histidine kinase
MRRSLGLPITLAIIMIVLLVALIVGWVLLVVFGVAAKPQAAVVFWTVLPLGIVFLAVVLAGVIVYLVLSIKAINLSRRQSNFIDSVTHELKSPIASLKLYAQTLNRVELSRDEQMQFYRFMLEDVERLDHLINHLLEAARLEKTPDFAENEMVDLDELIRSCAAAVCGRHRAPPETISLDLDPCVMRARRVDLEMIFQNLIDNAVKYGGSPPQVEITLRLADGQTAVARVIDNGRGIPIALRRKIFGRFVRLGVELERKSKGTGLGLYIVGTLVRRLRGKVQVQDRAEGSGSVFEVRLPARAKAAEPSPEFATV